MVPAFTGLFELFTGLFETDRRVPAHHIGQRLLNQPVVLGFECVLIATPWQSHHLASLANTALLLLNEIINSFSFFSRPNYFFSRNALIARFSKVSSATIFLYWLSSVSISFIFFTSLTSMPPYLAFQL